MPLAYRSWTRAGSACLALIVLSGCPAGNDPPDGVVVEEIPITTASDAARDAFLRGQELLDRGRYLESNDYFEKAAAEDPTFAYAHLMSAYTASSAQRFASHIKQAAASTEGKSDGEKLLVDISQTYFDNDAEKRIELGRKLVGLYPRSPRAWLNLAGMQKDLHQQEASRESIARALELDPDFVPTHFMIWGSYLGSDPKDFDRAEHAMRRVLEIEPKEAKAHENLGDVFRAKNELEEARAAYDRAAELDPELAVASLKKGHINSFLGRFEEARADYDTGLAAAKKLHQVTYANYRAFVHLHADDPQAALAELDGLMATADASEVPADQMASAEIFTLTNQLTIALHHGLFEDAERLLSRLSEVMMTNSEAVADPNFTRLQKANLLMWEGQLAARRGDYALAREKAEEQRALLADDRNPRRFEAYHGILGLVALLQGDYETARQEIAKSDLDMMYVKYHLALAEEGAGNMEKARELFREVAEWNFNSVGYALVRRDALARIDAST